MDDLRGGRSDDSAGGPGSPREATIEGQQGAGKRFGERQVPAIVNADVVAQFPDAISQRFERERLDTERQQIATGEIGLGGRQPFGKLQSAKNVARFREDDLWARQGTAFASCLRYGSFRPGAVHPEVGDRRRKDRGINDDRHFRSASRACRMLSVVT